MPLAPRCLTRFHPGRALTAGLLLMWPSAVALAQDSTVTIEAGYNSADSYRSGRFTGLTDRGGFAVAGFSLHSPAGDGSRDYWRVNAQDLGLESSSLDARYGRWGSFSLSLDYSRLPHYRFDDGRSPYLGSATALQRLPPDWFGASSSADLSSLDSSLRQVSIDTDRERYLSELSWQMSDSWRLLGEYRHETRNGTAPLGAIFGSTGGNPRGAILARPVDFQTDEFTLGLSYVNEAAQYNLAYSSSLFRNANKSLLFDNPFNNPAWAAGANFSDGAVGEIALEPDNRLNQISLSGARSLGRRATLSASLVSSRLEQDDQFLPYSNVLPAAAPLPRENLAGRVDSLLGSVNFSTRLTRRNTLRLRYNYNERDNETPRALYQRIPGDAATQSPLVSGGTRANRIYDTTRSRLSTEINHNFTARTRLSANYTRTDTDRSMVDTASTEEDSVFLRLKTTLSSFASTWIKLSHSDRNSSAYDSTVPYVSGHNPDYVATLVGNEIFENDPLLRRFHLTDRDRDELSVSLNLYPDGIVGASFLALYLEDEYPAARVGLQRSEKLSLALDLSLTPAADWQGNLYFNYEDYSNQQAGFARRGGGNPTPFFPEAVRDPGNNWRLQSEDEVFAIGAGVDWTLLARRLELSLDANYTDATTETRPFSPGLAFQSLPDSSTRISTLSLDGDYRLRPDRTLSIGYRYERYESLDWAVDGIQSATLSNILLLGNQSPDYSGHIFRVAIRFELE